MLGILLAFVGAIGTEALRKPAKPPPLHSMADELWDGLDKDLDIDLGEFGGQGLGSVHVRSRAW